MSASPARPVKFVLFFYALRWGPTPGKWTHRGLAMLLWSV